MIDGQIDLDCEHVWFCFDLQELEWLYDLIPRGDDFKKTIVLKIRQLEQHAKRQQPPTR